MLGNASNPNKADIPERKKSSAVPSVSRNIYLSKPIIFRGIKKLNLWYIGDADFTFCLSRVNVGIFSLAMSAIQVTS